MDFENTTPEQQEQERAMFPACYLDQTRLVELRRFVCLDMARACGTMPDKMVRVANDMERFLIGHGLRVANDAE